MRMKGSLRLMFSRCSSNLHLVSWIDRVQLIPALSRRTQPRDKISRLIVEKKAAYSRGFDRSGRPWINILAQDLR